MTLNRKFSRFLRVLRKHRCALRVISLFIITSLLFLFPIRILIEKKSAPYVLPSIEVSAKSELSRIISDATLTLLDKKEYSSKLTKHIFSENGEIIGITLDSMTCAGFVSALNSELSVSLSGIKIVTPLHIGTILFPSSLSGRGAAIKVKSSCNASALSRIESNVRSAGVNQSLHTLTLVTEVNANIISFGRSESISFEMRTILSETLTVGKDPDGIISGK